MLFVNYPFKKKSKNCDLWFQLQRSFCTLLLLFPSSPSAVPLCVTGPSQERAGGSWGVVRDNQGILATCSWAPRQGWAGITWPVYSAGLGERGCVQGLINHGRFGRDKQPGPSGGADAPG